MNKRVINDVSSQPGNPESALVPVLISGAWYPPAPPPALRLSQPVAEGPGPGPGGGGPRRRRLSSSVAVAPRDSTSHTPAALAPRWLHQLSGNFQRPVAGAAVRVAPESTSIGRTERAVEAASSERVPVRDRA